MKRKNADVAWMTCLEERINVLVETACLFADVQMIEC